MNKRTKFVLTMLALIVVIAAAIFVVYRFRIGADTTVVTTSANLTPDTAKTILELQMKEWDKINLEIKAIPSFYPPNVGKMQLQILNERKALIGQEIAASVSFLKRDPAYKPVGVPDVPPAVDEIAAKAEEVAAKARSDYSIKLGVSSYSTPATPPGVEQLAKREELRSIIAQTWPEAKKLYDSYGQNPTDTARISSTLKLFSDKIQPFLQDGVLPTETKTNLVDNFLAEDGINMETSLMVSQESAVGFVDSILGISNDKFDREKFDFELKEYYAGQTPANTSSPKFTAEQIDQIVQAMFPSYATAVANYKKQMELYAKYSDEIKIAGMASFMANGDADRFSIIYSYIVEHKDISMMKLIDSGIPIEMKMELINEYFKRNDIFRKAYGSSIGINPNTGHAEYTSVLREKIGDKQYRTLGYISFDPTNNSLDAEIPLEYGKRDVTLFSDPRTGDVWAEFGNADSSPLVGEGKIGLMSVTVSKAGKIGGQFRVFNRLFAYNPNSGAFEMPIKLSNRAQITIDTKGNVSGNVGVFGDSASKTQGGLFFDRNGNMGITLDLRTATNEFGRVSTASVMYSRDGGIAGSVDMGKIISGSNASSFFLSFDKTGVTGVNLPFGSWAGKPFGLGISMSGSLSFGGFVPIAGIPIPVGIAQDSSGGFRLAWPGGSLGIIGGDERPQNPPELKVDKTTGNYDASCVYYRHSFKKAFMAVRVYQIPCETIDRTEQIERGDMIIKVYSELLGRNPSIGEFLNWYFYSGHELYAYPDHNQKAYRMTTTESSIRRVIKSGPYKNMSDQFKFPNKEEYQWIKSGKDPLKYAKRPKETLSKNPFADGSLDLSDQKYGNATMADLVKAIENSSKTDDKKIIDQTSVIQDIGAETPATDDTTTSTDQATSTTAPTSQSTTTTPTNTGNGVATGTSPAIESTVVDPNATLSEIPATNELAKSRIEVVKNATTELNKIALTLEEKQLAEKMIEVARQQVEAENQIIAILNRLESQSAISSFLIGPNSDSIDEINKAQIDNSVRNKTLNQISAKVADNKVAEDIYTQNRSIELANQEIQQAVDSKQEQFSLFGWLIKLYKNIFS